MKRPILFALLAAVPIEAVNLKFFVFPIDVGIPPDAPWYAKLLCGQWLLMHLPAILSFGWLDRMGLLHRLGYTVLFVDGYAETAFLLIALVFLFRWFRHLARRFPPNLA